MKLIKNVKEDLLCFLPVGEELNVINDQHINILVEVDKIADYTILDGVYDIIGKFLSGHIPDGTARLPVFDLVADRLCKMGLAQSDSAKQE